MTDREPLERELSTIRRQLEELVERRRQHGLDESQRKAYVDLTARELELLELLGGDSN